MTGRLTVVGLGPGDPDLRTVGAQRSLAEAERIILRTAIHPGIGDLIHDQRTTTCDDLYERCASFDAVYEAIVDRVLTAARTHQVVYAVPGHPRFGERTVGRLIARAEEAENRARAADTMAKAMARGKATIPTIKPATTSCKNCLWSMPDLTKENSFGVNSLSASILF